MQQLASLPVVVTHSHAVVFVVAYVLRRHNKNGTWPKRMMRMNAAKISQPASHARMMTMTTTMTLMMMMSYDDNDDVVTFAPCVSGRPTSNLAHTNHRIPRYAFAHKRLCTLRKCHQYTDLSRSFSSRRALFSRNSSCIRAKIVLICSAVSAWESRTNIKQQQRRRQQRPPPQQQRTDSVSVVKTQYPTHHPQIIRQTTRASQSVGNARTCCCWNCRSISKCSCRMSSFNSSLSSSI